MKTLILSLLMLIALSCNNDENEDLVSQTITPVLIGKGNLYVSSFNTNLVQHLVFTNTSDWTAFLDKMKSSSIKTEEFSEINVDFNSYQIIAVLDAERPSGGHSIDVTKVVESANNITITIENILKGNATTVMSQPYHIIKLPKSSKPIVYN